MAGIGKLTKAQNDCLKTHLDRMIKTMNVPAVLDFLADATVVNSYAKEEMIEMDRHEQAYELYSLLKRKGELAFKVFYDALNSTGHYDFVRIIDNEAPVSDLEDDNTDWHFPNPISRKSSFRSASFKSKEKPQVTKRMETGGGDEDKEFRMNLSLPSPSIPPPRSSFYSNENINVARMSRDVLSVFPDDTYRMTSSPKGNVLIINNMNFNGMPYRDGSSVDEENLRKLFAALDYRIHAHKNLSAEEMCREMRRFAALDDHRYRSSAIVVVLSHGEAGVIYGCDDREVNEHRFISALNASNAPLLAGKPKVFFMQACRGEGKDRGFAVDETDGNVPSAAAERTMRLQNDGPQVKLPLEADIVVCRSTPLGYVSWRNSRDGTWFVQALCEVFQEYARTDEIMSLLTKVNNRVSSKFESSKERCKQIGEISSRLRKKLFFFPPHERSLSNNSFV